MPWEVTGGLATCSGWAVVKKGDSRPVRGGCHDTKAEAERHLAALYANYQATAEALAAAGQRIATVAYGHHACPPSHPYAVIGHDGGKVTCHADKAAAQDLARHLNVPDAYALTPGGGIDVGAAFNPDQPRDKEGRWLAEALKNLPVRRQLGFRGHTIDTTANKGYRVRLKTGEVRHYRSHEDAARAAREGKHHDAGTPPPKAPARKAAPPTRELAPPLSKEAALAQLARIATIHGPGGGATGKRATADQLGNLDKLTADEAALMGRHLTGIHIVDGPHIPQAAAKRTIGAGFKIEAGHRVAGLYWQGSRRLAVAEPYARSLTMLHEVGHAMDHAYGQAAMSPEFAALDKRVLAAQPNPSAHYHPDKNANGPIAATRERFAELYGQYKMGAPYDLQDPQVGHTIGRGSPLAKALDAYFKDLHASRASHITAAGPPPDHLCVAVVDDAGHVTYENPEPEEEPMPQAAVQVLIPDTEAGGYDEHLHPRDAHGHWVSKTGGGTARKPARPPAHVVTPAQGKAVDDAIAKVETDLAATRQQLQAEQHAELEKMLAEIKATHAALLAEERAETQAGLAAEEKHRTKVKLIHHLLALAAAAFLSWLSLRMDINPLLGVISGYGPLFLQEGADALRKV
jgi:hypothetical protein